MSTTPYQKRVGKLLRRLIEIATTKERLEELDRRVTNHYNNGTITSGQLSRLDVMIMEKIAKMEALA